MKQFSAVKRSRKDHGENERTAGYYVFLVNDSHDKGGYQCRNDYAGVFLFAADTGIVHYHSGDQMRCHVQYDRNDNAIPQVMVFDREVLNARQNQNYISYDLKKRDCGDRQCVYVCKLLTEFIVQCLIIHCKNIPRLKL